MLDQSKVERWLQEFLEQLNERFDKRLIFVAHHGSWARGEARPDSDIDAFVLLDKISASDLETYRNLIYAMSDEQCSVSTFLGSVDELKVWPRHEQIQCFYGSHVLHGCLEDLVDKPTDKDFIEDIRIKASTNLHHARHYLLHPHDLNTVVHRLYYPFKECYYAMQSWMLLTTGKYFARKADMIMALRNSDDREVIRVTKDWAELSDDRTQKPMHYIHLLERWSRKMLSRITQWV